MMIDAQALATLLCHRLSGGCLFGPENPKYANLEISVGVLVPAQRASCAWLMECNLPSCKPLAAELQGDDNNDDDENDDDENDDNNQTMLLDRAFYALEDLLHHIKKDYSVAPEEVMQQVKYLIWKVTVYQQILLQWQVVGAAGHDEQHIIDNILTVGGGRMAVLLAEGLECALRHKRGPEGKALIAHHMLRRSCAARCAEIAERTQMVSMMLCDVMCDVPVATAEVVDRHQETE